jgi:Fe-S-cluster formation regulator IscX/YfhJ
MKWEDYEDIAVELNESYPAIHDYFTLKEQDILKMMTDSGLYAKLPVVSPEELEYHLSEILIAFIDDYISTLEPIEDDSNS